MNVIMLERVAAVIGAILVGSTAGVALRNDWRTPGLENQVFKVMLGLLALGAVLAFFAAIGILGNA
jgi:F0F1-type ATP synthase membrane subunit c/vacuolar-type H+-ATPase subunit K